MELMQNLIPDEKIITIQDRQYKIKKLSIKQVLLLTKFIFNNIYNNKEKFSVFSSRISEQNNKNNLQDILVMLDLLDEEQIYYLIGVLINETDKKFIEDNVDFDLCVNIITDLIEVNQKSNIKKNLQKVFQLMTANNNKEGQTPS